MSSHRKVTELGLPVFEPSVNCGPHCYGGVAGMEEQKHHLDSMEIDSDTWVRGSDCIALVDRIAELEAWKKETREALAEIREVYAGSEGIPVAETAAEAYVLRLVEQMYEIAISVLEDGDE